MSCPTQDTLQSAAGCASAAASAAKPAQCFSLKAELERFWGHRVEEPPAAARSPSSSPRRSATPSRKSADRSRSASRASKASKSSESSAGSVAPPPPSPVSKPSSGVAVPQTAAGARSGRATGGSTVRRSLKRVRSCASADSGSDDGRRERGGGRRRSGRAPRSASPGKRKEDGGAKAGKATKAEEPAPVEPRTSRKSRGLGWDTPPTLMDLVQMGTPELVPRKRRELYCGNLLAGGVDCLSLRQAFKRLFDMLPQFRECYPDLTEPILAVAFHKTGGIYAFVEFADEVLATTALKMAGFELCGRPMKIDRPANYAPPITGELPPLDITPLKQAGLVPNIPDTVSIQSIQKTRGPLSKIPNKLCELYIGNLPPRVSRQMIEDLLMPPCLEMSEYNPAMGPPISQVQMSLHSNFCFVMFQNPDMATKLIDVFDGMEFFARPIKVARPQGYAEALASVELSLATNLPKPPPPTSPPPPSVVAAAAAAAAFAVPPLVPLPPAPSLPAAAALLGTTV